MAVEFDRKTLSGWAVLPAIAAATVGDVWQIIQAIRDLSAMSKAEVTFAAVMPLIGWCMGLIVVVVLWTGFFTLEPNTAGVQLLFGNYRGTVRRPGFHWVNPFVHVNKVSLRVRTLNGNKLKVNDQRGNPVEIAAVVVWRVEDTARACFDVDNYAEFVAIQSESAVRHLASLYPYDANEEARTSLRANRDEISKALRTELKERLAVAGVAVDEAWLSHLAYAPEIASAMLRRQQAEAVVAARTRIVEGAVGMVHLALQHLEQDGIVALDPERKAVMVSNLLVVLCSEHAATPVVNAGTLYT